MKISAEVVAASVSPADYKIVTLKVTFPRILLPEFLTHRELSRNFTSNRAMPASAAAAMTGFVPLHWGLAQAGMQSKEEELSEIADVGLGFAVPKKHANKVWDDAMLAAQDYAGYLDHLGLHKQTVNRLLEPFQWCVGVVTATSQAPGEWPMSNFLGLRAKSAKVEPHMHELSWCVADAIKGASWNELRAGDWHLPFISARDATEYVVFSSWEDSEVGEGSRECAMASAMRCARASYNKLDGGSATVAEDAESALSKLMAPVDLHGSPFEHQAMCPSNPQGFNHEMHGSHIRSGNFMGWVQFRQQLDGNRSTFTDADYAVGRVRKLRGDK